MTNDTQQFIQNCVAHFKQFADPDQAKAMAAYMRNLFSFLGIKRPQRKVALKSFLLANELPPPEQAAELLMGFWQLPAREFQYLGMEIYEKYKKHWSPDHLPVLEKLIQEKSWWDTVDWIASNPVGHILRKHPELASDYPDRWIKSDDMWLQRTAILYQLKYKEEVDENRLFRYILQHRNSSEFFLQKASGWALRQYSKFNPERVRWFLDQHELPALTVREGGKYL